MAKVESKLITRKVPWHANMTEMNHLGAALIAKPHVFESTFTKLFTSEQYSGNPLTAILTGQAREETITSSDWEWDLRGASTRPLVIIGRVEADSNVTHGRYNQTFRIKADEPWWLAGDIVCPPADKKFQCRVQEVEGRTGGSQGCVYVLKIMSDDPTIFIDDKYLQQGVQWSKLYSQYEEASEQDGSTQFSMPISLKNHMSRFRKQYQVTGDVANEVLAIKMRTSTGQMVDSWIKYAEVEYWQQWYKELERSDWYSRSTDKVKGANGRPVRSGPGVQEQLEDSHIHRFSHLSARLIEEYLMDIFYARVTPGAARHIKGFTGEYGMLNFHRAINTVARKDGFTTVDSNFIQKASSDVHDNSLSYGYQFTKYKMPNGSTLELVLNPLYDDREINTEMDEVTGYPKESQRITFLDFSGKDATSNVRLVKKKNSFKLGYVAGMHTPYGPTNNKLMSHSGDYYSMHVHTQQGVHIEDVTRCGELILDRN